MDRSAPINQNAARGNTSDPKPEAPVALGLPASIQGVFETLPVFSVVMSHLPNEKYGQLSLMSASIRQAGHCALPVPLCAYLYLAPVWLVLAAASRCRLLLSGMRCLLTSITVRHSGLGN